MVLEKKFKLASEKIINAKTEAIRNDILKEQEMKLKAANDQIKKLEEIKELKIEALTHAEEAIRRKDDNMKREIKSKADKISELESRCKKLEKVNKLGRILILKLCTFEHGQPFSG